MPSTGPLARPVFFSVTSGTASKFWAPGVGASLDTPNLGAVQSLGSCQGGLRPLDSHEEFKEWWWGLLQSKFWYGSPEWR